MVDMLPQYAIREATPADITAVMRIELQSFADGIAESEAVFTERLRYAEHCNYVLVRQTDKAVCGYLTAEIWKADPQTPEAFALGHSVYERHCAAGTALYISSFALAPELRSQKLKPVQYSSAADTDQTAIGAATFFFSGALKRITAAFPQLKKLILLVHEDWRNAIRIYEAQGFTRIAVLERFPAFGGKQAYIYEKTAPSPDTPEGLNHPHK